MEKLTQHVHAQGIFAFVNQKVKESFNPADLLYHFMYYDSIYDNNGRELSGAEQSIELIESYDDFDKVGYIDNPETFGPSDIGFSFDLAIIEDNLVQLMDQLKKSYDNNDFRLIAKCWRKVGGLLAIKNTVLLDIIEIIREDAYKQYKDHFTAPDPSDDLPF
jgi:hypothetical protein